MSSREITGRYRAYIAALNARQFEEAAAFYADQVLFDDQPFARDAFRDQVLTVGHQIAPDTQITIEGMVADEFQLAARLIRTGTATQAWMGLAPSGQPTALREHVFYSFSNGLCDRVWSVLDLGPLLNTAGTPN